jgi:hypothetical protein
MRTAPLALIVCGSATPADWLPVAVWYGRQGTGSNARARRAAKKEVWRKDIRQISARGFNTVRTCMDHAGVHAAGLAFYALATLGSKRG